MRYKPSFKIFISLLLFLTLSAVNSGGYAFAASETPDVHEQLEENIREQLDGIDTSLFDKFINSLDEGGAGVFGSGTFKEKIEKLLSGEISDISEILQLALEAFFAQALKLLPLIASVVALAVLGGLLAAVKSEKTKTGGVIHFVCYLSIVLIVLSLVYQLVSSVVNSMRLITDFMGLIFPLILTLMTASGSAMSSGIYQPAVALLCGLVSGIIIGVIIPIFIASIIFNVVSNLTDNINVGKFADFFKSAGKWAVGVTFTVFMAFLSIQGILASTYDSVSIRTIKYAIGNSIPFVGGYIKEGFDLVTGSAVLIKNAVGVAGLIMLFCFVLAPIINLIVCSLGLKLTAAVCQPISDPKVPKFLQSVASSFNMLIAAFAAAAFMFFITLMLLLMTSNAVLV